MKKIAEISVGIQVLCMTPLAENKSKFLAAGWSNSPQMILLGESGEKPNQFDVILRQPTSLQRKHDMTAEVRNVATLGDVVVVEDDHQHVEAFSEARKERVAFGEAAVQTYFKDCKLDNNNRNLLLAADVLLYINENRSLISHRLVDVVSAMQNRGTNQNLKRLKWSSNVVHFAPLSNSRVAVLSENGFVEVIQNVDGIEKVAGRVGNTNNRR